MLAYVRPAGILVALFTLLTGLAYPLTMTGLSQLALPNSANGSLIVRDGVTIGSRLIAQAFTSDRYFRARPSAAGEKGYDAVASSGSNLGPTSRKLALRIDADVALLKMEGATIIPADAVTASASGLDPHISTEFALLQVPRVAAARKVTVERVKSLVEQNTKRGLFGIFGEPRVNVLELNLALDAALGKDAR
ncbi:MAG: potassium-transporting ATPase subunit KdpC [Hyphomicrobiaceae bacterium]|nr:MAG: potassium-transporting ATPase subunit KdpC [Hyphomicrobiaceae bacterium]